MLHTSIWAYANRNGIFVRLVASFPLLFTTSGNVICSKFSEVWETLWIIKVARWNFIKVDRWPKINKSPTVSNGLGPSSFEIWTANLAQSLTVDTLTNSQSFIFGDLNWKFCKVSYHTGPQKPDIQMRTFMTWDFFIFYALFFSENKTKKLSDIQEHCICKLGKIRSKLKLLFGVYYWFLKLYTGIIWHSYFPSEGIS